MSTHITRCEADTYYGGVCGGSVRTSYGHSVCLYAGSHLRTVEQPYLEGYRCSPDSPYHVIGRAVLLTERTFHEMSQYPGADRMLLAQPQTVMLTSNGYFCAYAVTGEITGRGYYGGPLGVTEKYIARPYTYEVRDALTQRGGLTTTGDVRYELDEGVVLTNRVV